MPRPKVYVTSENALEIYHYFSNAIHKKQLLDESSNQVEIVYEAFSNLEIPSAHHSQTDMKKFSVDLQKWVDDYVPLKKWQRCLATLRQIRSTQRHGLKTLKLSPETYYALTTYAKDSNLSLQDTLSLALKQLSSPPQHEPVSKSSLVINHRVTIKNEKGKGLIPDNSGLILPESIHKKIKKWADARNRTVETTLTDLVDQEEERLKTLLYLDENPIDNSNRHSKLKEISELCASYFSPINHKSGVFEITCTIEKLHKDLLKNRFLSTKVDSMSIIASRHVHIPQIHYYYFGGSLAKYISRWFGTIDVYMNAGIFPQHEMLFLGMPNNTDVSVTVFEFLCRLFCKIKSTYKKTLGTKYKGSEGTSLTNLHLTQFARKFEDLNAWIGNEDDCTHLYEYADKQYPFARY